MYSVLPCKILFVVFFYSEYHIISFTAKHENFSCQLLFGILLFEIIFSAVKKLPQHMTLNVISSRKEKWEPERTPEPSKPLHRYHTVSRICSKRSLFSGPKVLGGIDSDSFLSTPGYSDKAKQTYLQQCFQTTKILGEGSFGRVICTVFRNSFKSLLYTLENPLFRETAVRKQKFVRKIFMIISGGLLAGS